MVQVTNDHGCRHRSVLNLAGFLARSAVNGPGIRSVVWVQGCPIRCTGCFNPQSWSFSPANPVPVSDLADRILALNGLDGVTFSGGEPFAQAEALARLGRQVRGGGLSVVTFTGFSYSHILAMHRSSWEELLSVTDLLIAGPYVPSLRCSSSLRSSSNQEILPLTGAIEIPRSLTPENGPCTEFTISPDGSLTTTGFPDRQFLQQMASQMVSNSRGG